ncbi:MAG: DUF3307 domain-containing protein [Lachnospiraceae bacterium]|nr:DUF3307 domain-containing protein [Lachnospiraceae bacterium]
MVDFIFLIILHLIGDFYLQTSKIAQCKNSKQRSECIDCQGCKVDSWINLKYLMIHSFVYVVPFVMLYFIVDSIGQLKVTIIILLLLIIHGCIDLGACFFYKKKKQTMVFLIDQFLHIVPLWCIYYFIPFQCNLSSYTFVIKIIFMGLTLIMPCSVLINKLFEDIYPETVTMDIFDIGSVIGIMERILTIIFSCFGNFAAIAIIITVKTWARTNDLKETEFRNKYLLGTLTSLVLSLLIFLVYKSI